MIKTLLFDFGDVFINLDKTAPDRALTNFGKPELLSHLIPIGEKYEVGGISTKEFIDAIKFHFSEATSAQALDAWNSMLLDFPEHRLEFIKHLAENGDYQLILLSNTNEAHISWIEQNIPFYVIFKECFDTFYLSHEIQLRKPTADIFEFVLRQHHLTPSEILFIDDTKANTDAASKLGIHTWNIDPVTEDVVNLFTIKSELF